MESATTTKGLATPPLPAAQPLVYITGSTPANKQCVAEYLALLLGDEAVLVDHPYTSTWTPPPPSPSLPRDTSSSSSSTRQRPKGPFIASSYCSPSTTFSQPTSRSRSISTSTAHRPPTTPFFDPLLVTLSSHPSRTAILTDTKRSSSSSLSRPVSVPPLDAANQTGRQLIRVRLGSSSSASAAAEQVDFPNPHQSASPPSTSTTPPPAGAPLELRHPSSNGDGDGDDPHAVAQRIVQFLKELDADATRRRTRGGGGDWEAVSELGRGAGDDDDDGRVRAGVIATDGCKRMAGGGRLEDCVCGVITPLLTPGEERELRF